MLWMESNIMAAIPWTTWNRLSVEMTRHVRTSLTKPGWVAIGDTYATADAHLDRVQEQPFLLGRDIDVPKHLMDVDGQFEDPMALKTELTMKEFAYEFNEAAINGPMINSDGSNNPNALVGIRQRIEDLDGLPGLALVKSGATTLFGPTAQTANRHTVLDELNAAMYFIDGKRPDCAFLNDTLLLAIESAFRREGLFADSRDAYERIVYTFRNVPLYDVGLKANQTDKIITDTEVLGGNADNTSIYFVKTGEKTHFHGWERSALDTRDLGELQTSAVVRRRVDWQPGLANWHVRSLARVEGIRAGT